MTGDFPYYVFHFWCQSGADVFPPASYFYRRKEIYIRQEWLSTFPITFLIFGAKMEQMSFRPLLNYIVGKYIYFRHQLWLSFPVRCLILAPKWNVMSFRPLLNYTVGKYMFISGTDDGRLLLLRVSFLAPKWSGGLSARSLFLPSLSTCLFQTPMMVDFCVLHVPHFWRQTGADVSPPATYFYRR